MSVSHSPMKLDADGLKAASSTAYAEFTQHFEQFRVKSFKYYESASGFQLFRDAVFILVILRLVAYLERKIVRYGLIGAPIRVLKLLIGNLFVTFYRLPIISASVDKEINKQLEGVEKMVIKRDAKIESHPVLPPHGLNTKQLGTLMDSMKSLSRTDWQKGRCTGAVYHGGQELIALQSEVYHRYAVANQLHPDCFPDVRQMESEVVAMVLDLFNGPEGSCGTSTSGGTESLLLTCLAARDKARLERGVTHPEIIAPITIHAGFDKAAHYFGMDLIHAPVDPKTYQVDLKAVEKLITPRTVLLAGSAPNYPHGIVDDIQGLSDLALKYDLPLHVDACLGSFIVPFAKDIPPFDFRVLGVTSISCDTHKYGFAPKGSSIIMYRSPSLRKYQYFVSTDWSGGLYASPTLAGSRPGALMAGCWATLLYMGKDGYEKSARDILATAQKFRVALDTDPLLKSYVKVIGDPRGPVVAFDSEKVNIYDIGDALSKRGWHLGSLQNPPSIHLAVTRLTIPVIDELIGALKEVVLEQSDSTPPSGDTKVLYGVAGSVSTVGFAKRLAEGFVDCLYKL